MAMRTTKSMVTFTRPFNLNGFDGEQPAGSYAVETDEELLEGVSLPAYRRMATMMQRDASSRGSAGVLQVAVINPDELAAALAADAAADPDGDEFATWRALNMPGAAFPKR